MNFDSNMKRSKSECELRFDKLIGKRLINSGSYGKVYQVEILIPGNLNTNNTFPFVDLTDGCRKLKCAMKKFPFITDKNDIKAFEREARIMESCDHKNVVKIFHFEFHQKIHKKPFRFCFDRKKIYEGRMFMELCEDTNLFNYIELYNQNLSNIDRLNYLVQIAEGMIYLHEKKNIIHRDLKPSNILFEVDSNFKILKICDFGGAKKMNSITDSLSGTAEYVAPEIVNLTITKSNLNHKTLDIYSFGLIIWFMWVGISPYSDHPNYENIKCNAFIFLRFIHKKSLRPSIEKFRQKNPPIFIESMMIKCWREHPKDRYQSFKEILKVLKDCQAFLKKSRISRLCRSKSVSKKINNFISGKITLSL